MKKGLTLALSFLCLYVLHGNSSEHPGEVCEKKGGEWAWNGDLNEWGCSLLSKKISTKQSKPTQTTVSENSSIPSMEVCEKKGGEWTWNGECSFKTQKVITKQSKPTEAAVSENSSIHPGELCEKEGGQWAWDGNLNAWGCSINNPKIANSMKEYNNFLAKPVNHTNPINKPKTQEEILNDLYAKYGIKRNASNDDYIPWNPPAQCLGRIGIAQQDWCEAMRQGHEEAQRFNRMDKKYGGSSRLYNNW